MPIDSQIPLQIRPFQLQGPMEQTQGALTLAGLIDQHRQRQMQMQQAQQQQAQQAEYRAALQAAGDDPEKQVAVARRYGAPKDVLNYAQGSLDRRAQMQQRMMEQQQALHAKKEQAEQALAAKIQLAQQSGADRRALMEMQMQGRREIAGLMAAAQQESARDRLALQRESLELRKDTISQKQNVAAAQDASAVNNVTANMDRMAQEANRLLKHPGLSKTTGIMSIVPLAGGLATVPGTDAANFKAGLETLKSQVGFSVLQAMRDAAKTGGALGQVSDFENRMLQANLAALDTAQDEKEFKAALKKIVDYTDGAKSRMKNAFEAKHRGVGGLGQPQAPHGEAPAGVDHKVWAVMTPEEKALWK